MGYGTYLRELLGPLGIYDLTPESLSGSELDALGQGLDQVSERLDEVEREAALATARGEGLDRLEALFAKAPVNHSLSLRREAIAALLRIGEGDLTLSAINGTITGCGINAVAREMDRFGYIRVTFPDVVGVPDGFDQIREIILDIIPCHLEVEFFFRFLIWAECHASGYTWRAVQQNRWSWMEFQTAV